MSELVKMNDHSIKATGFFEQGDIYTNSLSPNTQRAYINDIKEFFFGAEAKSYSLSDITIDQLRMVDASTAREYTEELVKLGRAKSTINRKLTALSSLYRFLCRREIGIMIYNPFSTDEGATRLKHNKTHSNTRCLTKEEVQKVVRITMEGSDIEAVRNRIIILMLATTGLRRTELVKIKLGDIKKSHGFNVIEIEGKGDKERYIKVNDTIKTFIDKYVELRGVTYRDKELPLFVSHTRNAKHFGENKGISAQSIYNLVKKIADQAGIDAEDVSPHCFRHTFVTEALDMGIAIQDVADMAGHSSLATTRRYDHTKRVLKNSPADALASMFLAQ